MICAHNTTTGRPAQPDVHFSFGAAASNDNAAIAKRPPLKLVSDIENAAARHAKSADGSRNTFISAESCDAALGYRKRQIKPRGPKKWTKGKYRSICNLRLSGLSRLIAGRHGGPIDTDDAEAYYFAALPHLVAKSWAYNQPESRIMSHEWATRWAPVFAIEQGRAWFEEQEHRILSEFDNHDGRPTIPSADDFALSLGITSAEVAAHSLKAVGAVDRLKAQRMAEQKAADRAYSQRRRAASGATPRDQSLAARKPWQALGMTRPTYYRKVAKGEIAPDPAMNVTIEAPEPEHPVLHLVRAA